MTNKLSVLQKASRADERGKARYLPAEGRASAQVRRAVRPLEGFVRRLAG